MKFNPEERCVMHDYNEPHCVHVNIILCLPVYNYIFIGEHYSSASEHNKTVSAMLIKDVSLVPDCKFSRHCITGKLIFLI